MTQPPLLFLLLMTAGIVALGVFGLRGLLDIREALRLGELNRLSAPPRWPVTRAFAGACGGTPVLVAAWPLGAGAWASAVVVAGLGYWVAPQFLTAARRRVEQEIADDLALHLDLAALAMEAGSSLPAALAVCAEKAPDGTLRRAWSRVMLEIHGGIDPIEALRGLEQRAGVRALTSLVAALRAADRLNQSTSEVLRERARQSSAQRFAHAERLARAAPLKLWAALVLAIAPCTLVVLAFPVARLLARLAG